MYQRVNWQDGPTGGTPLSAANLNIMDKGIADLDAALTAHKTSGDHDSRYYTKSQIDALLSSRIVDHNLDVPNPPNGWYVRWGNGLQVCFRMWAPWGANDLSGVRSTTWTFPATFSSPPFAVLATPAPAPGDEPRMIVNVSRRSDRTATSVGVFARAIWPMSPSMHNVEMVAIGVWS